MANGAIISMYSYNKLASCKTTLNPKISNTSSWYSSIKLTGNSNKTTRNFWMNSEPYRLSREFGKKHYLVNYFGNLVFLLVFVKFGFYNLKKYINKLCFVENKLRSGLLILTFCSLLNLEFFMICRLRLALKRYLGSCLCLAILFISLLYLNLSLSFSR